MPFSRLLFFCCALGSFSVIFSSRNCAGRTCCVPGDEFQSGKHSPLFPLHKDEAVVEPDKAEFTEMIPVETTIVDPVIGVKAHENLQSEPEMSLPAPEQKENYVTTEDSETQPPSNLPSKILKSEPNVSSVVSTNASSQPDISPGFIAPEPIQDYDEWTKRKLEEQHRTKIADIHSNTGGPSHHHHGNVVPRVAARNYAAGECNAKVLLFNKEAKNAKSILNEKDRDEYMLNPCQTESHKWFVVELCETILPTRFELANFELFSSSPKDFRVWSSERYPSPEWNLLGEWTAADKREIQEFEISSRAYAKVLKVELLSHYGSEHFCPLSLIRVFGISMVEEYEAEAVMAANTATLSSVHTGNLSESQNISSNTPKAQTIDSVNVTSSSTAGGNDTGKNGNAANLIGSVVDIAKDILSQVLPTPKLKNTDETANQDELGKLKMIWPLHRIRYNSACFSCRKSQNGTQLFKLCQFITLATGLKEYSSTVANGKYVVPTKQINGVRSTISSDEKTTVLLSETNRILEKTADQLIKSVLPAVKSIIKPLIVTSEQIELPDQTVTIQSDEIPNSTPANIEKSGVSSSILDDEHAEFITEETLPAVKCVTDKTTEKRSKVVAERPIRHSTSTVIDSSPDANMSEKTKETELKRATGSLLFPSGSPSQCRIWFLGNICFIDFDRHFRCGSEKLQCDKKEKVWLSTQKECEMANKRFWRLVVAGPTVPKPIDRKIADSTATINAVGTSASNSDAKLLPIDPAGVQIPHDGTSLPGTSLPSKESIFMRLSNRIRYLELNISLSSQYLNELSRRYRLQQEDNQRLLNRTTKAVEEVWQKVHHEMEKKDEKIALLSENLNILGETVKLLREQSLYLQEEAWKWHLVLVTIEVIFFTAVASWSFYTCQISRLSQVVEDSIQRHRSADEEMCICGTFGPVDRSCWSKKSESDKHKLYSNGFNPTCVSPEGKLRVDSGAYYNRSKLTRKVSAPVSCLPATSRSGNSHTDDEGGHERRRSNSLSHHQLTSHHSVFAGLSMPNLNPSLLKISSKSQRKRRLKGTTSMGSTQCPSDLNVPTFYDLGGSDTPITFQTFTPFEEVNGPQSSCFKNSSVKASLTTRNRFALFGSPEKVSR